MVANGMLAECVSGVSIYMALACYSWQSPHLSKVLSTPIISEALRILFYLIPN